MRNPLPAVFTRLQNILLPEPGQPPSYTAILRLVLLPVAAFTTLLYRIMTVEVLAVKLYQISSSRPVLPQEGATGDCVALTVVAATDAAQVTSTGTVVTA